MSKKVLDCRKLQCPMPVICTKKELEKEEVQTLEVLVDNAVARQNVEKFIHSMNLPVFSQEEEEGVFRICIENSAISKKSVEEKRNTEKVEGKNTVVLIKSEHLGEGNKELGALLMKSFLFSLTETKPYPQKVIFLNSGVKIPTENTEAIKNLKKLEEGGSEILSCGTCLDFYEKKDSLKVGFVGNMYAIVESLAQADKVVTI